MYTISTTGHAPADDHDVHHLLITQLRHAETAIAAGRIDDAHRALIDAQDLVFNLHLACNTPGFKREHDRSTKVYLHLTDRLVDANRAKDCDIIAECRSVVELLADAQAADQPVPAGSPVLLSAAV